MVTIALFFIDKRKAINMVKVIVKVEGMACGMCEAHVNESIKKAFVVKEVTSAHKDNVTEIIAESELDEEKIKEVIEAEGYTVLGVTTEEYKKKRFSFFGK